MARQPELEIDLRREILRLQARLTAVEALADNRERLQGELAACREEIDQLLTGRVEHLAADNQRLRVELSDEHRMFELLRAERALAEAAIEAMPGVFYVFDEAGVMRRWNQNLERVSGLDGSRIAISQPLDFIVLEDRERVAEAIVKVLESGSATVEARMRLADGGHAPYFFSASRSLVDSVRCVMGVGVDITERMQLEERLRAMSLTDELTGLLNRRGFLTLARRHLAGARRLGLRSVLVFADLDGLKTINDTFGHPIGDEALRDTAALFRNTFREGDLLGRVGGDEFAALATVGEEDVEALRRRFDAVLAQYSNTGERPYRLSLSLGLALAIPGESQSVEELIAVADEQMYADKADKNGE